jgi:hypothetical protein
MGAFTEFVLGAAWGSKSSAAGATISSPPVCAPTNFDASSELAPTKSHGRRFSRKNRSVPLSTPTRFAGPPAPCPWFCWFCWFGWFCPRSTPEVIIFDSAPSPEELPNLPAKDWALPCPPI